MKGRAISKTIRQTHRLLDGDTQLELRPNSSGVEAANVLRTQGHPRNDVLSVSQESPVDVSVRLLTADKDLQLNFNKSGHPGLFLVVLYL